MSLIALDIETTGLNPRQDRIHGVGLVSDRGECYVPATHSRLAEILADPNQHIVGHNIRFDLKFLRHLGLEIKAQFWDTQVLAQLIDENQKLGLKPLSIKYLGDDSLSDMREMDRACNEAGVKHVGALCAVDLGLTHQPYYEVIKRYCIEDCRNTLALWRELSQELSRMDSAMKKFGLKKTIRHYYLEEAQSTERVLLDMETRGVKIDVERFNEYKTEVESEAARIRANLMETAADRIDSIEDDLYERVLASKKSDKGKAGVQRKSVKQKTAFNLDSNQQLATLIYDKFNVPDKLRSYTSSGLLSTNDEALAKLQATYEGQDLGRFLKGFAEYRRVNKIMTTYTGRGKKGMINRIEDGRIYGRYIQTSDGAGGTVTGRLSSREPNMQNIPRGSVVKEFFVPDTEDHVFIYFDYSQLELRLAAHLSQDPMLMAGYLSGIDLHQQTGDAIGMPRQVGKTVNFLTIYDGSAWRLSAEIDRPVEECKQILSSFFGMYERYAEYLKEQKTFMRRHGKVISDAGRVRRLPDVIKFKSNIWSKEYRHAIKQGYNFPIQSLGATITKRAMCDLHRAGYDLVTQVHDSVIIQVRRTDVPQAIKDIKEIAENVYPLSVPLVADIKVLTSFSEDDTLDMEGLKDVG